MGRKNIACLMRRSRPPGSGYYAKAALASLFSLRCCSLAWRRRRSLRARSQSQAILNQHSCSRRDHRALPSIRGRTSTDAARDGTSCSIVRRCTVPVPTPSSLAVASMPFPARNWPWMRFSSSGAIFGRRLREHCRLRRCVPG